MGKYLDLVRNDPKASRASKAGAVAVNTRDSSSSQVEDAATPRSHQAAPAHNTVTPAMSIVTTCKRYDVLLRVDRDGTLVVTKPWQTLLLAIEAHADEIARLVEATWEPPIDIERELALNELVEVLNEAARITHERPTSAGSVIAHLVAGFGSTLAGLIEAGGYDEARDAIRHFREGLHVGEKHER